MPDLKAAVLEALRTVPDPDLNQDLVTLQMVKEVEVDGKGNARVVVQLTTPACPMKDRIRRDCEAAIRKVPGIADILIELTANTSRGAVPEGKQQIPGVRNVIAVGSGKGGVGKSTTAVNLAIGLQRLGARVGLLDADIYGPNIPGMLGIQDRPRVLEGKIIPLEACGLHTISMGFLVSDEQPMIWRGPMLHGVMKQLLFDVAWGDKDYLIVDMPPGTGDVPLSLSQMVPLTGAVVVTTPQNVALQDVRKAIGMFSTFKVPLIGIVENMAYYLCPKCGHRDEIFDHGGGERTALELDVPFLGAVPLNSSIRQAMDIGRPIALDDDTEFSTIYRDIAGLVARRVSTMNAAAGPRPFAVVSGP
jgi:ATP-binding protein involved in chromosome partitioning